MAGVQRNRGKKKNKNNTEPTDSCSVYDPSLSAHFDDLLSQIPGAKDLDTQPEQKDHKQVTKEEEEDPAAKRERLRKVLKTRISVARRNRSAATEDDLERDKRGRVVGRKVQSVFDVGRAGNSHEDEEELRRLIRSTLDSPHAADNIAKILGGAADMDVVRNMVKAMTKDPELLQKFFDTSGLSREDCEAVIKSATASD